MTAVPTLRLDGKVAVITGAGGLIGSALSAGFAASGASVVLVDVDEDALERVCSALSGEHLPIAADLTAGTTPADIVDRTVGRFGRIDILVNNAGINRRSLPHELTAENWSAMHDLDLKACFLLSQAVGKQMIAQGAGSIVNVSSTCGCSAMGRGNFAFSVAKAGVNHMTRELALEWGPSGVRVNAIAPSQVDSPGMRAWMEESSSDGERLGQKFLHGVPLGRLVTAEDMVGPVLFLASDAAAMVSGCIIPVDGGNLTANIVATPGAPLH